jgi:hypothetical protein
MDDGVHGQAMSHGQKETSRVSFRSNSFPERINDPQPVIDQQSVLHVFRPEGTAIGRKGRCDDHGVVDGEAVSFGEAETRRVSISG